jgi:hypothetical protein
MKTSNSVKKQIANFKKQSSKKEKKNKQKSNVGWILKITVLAFFISLIFSFTSESVIPNVNIIVGIILVIIFIAVGVLFDMIGIAVTTADEKPFHSMSAQKVRGASVAVIFQKNAAKVSSFCNDVIGDICGIISGSAGVIIASTLATDLNIDVMITTLIITAFIAALTIGGKAVGKTIAINKCNIILYEFAKVVSFFYSGKK